MKHFKTQFEQLNDYFKVHDKDNMLDLQSLFIYVCFIYFLKNVFIFSWIRSEIIETVKVTHRNLLNEAANLKHAHEQVEVSDSFSGLFDFYLSILLFSRQKELKKNFLAYKRLTTGETKNIFETSPSNDENLAPLSAKGALDFLK